jgi:hypothetical protein
LSTHESVTALGRLASEVAAAEPAEVEAVDHALRCALWTDRSALDLAAKVAHDASLDRWLAPSAFGRALTRIVLDDPICVALGFVGVGTKRPHVIDDIGDVGTADIGLTFSLATQRVVFAGREGRGFDGTSCESGSDCDEKNKPGHTHGRLGGRLTPLS